MTINIIIAVALIVLSSILTYIFSHGKYDGIMRINKHDPMKDTYTLELHIPFGEIDNRKRIIFKVEES